VMSMAELTEENYAAAIPAWCGYRTIEEHKDMLLCWSLVGYAERGEKRPYSSCKGCDLINRDYVPSDGAK